MKINLSKVVVLSAASFMVVGSAQAVTIFDEAVDTDLSGDLSAPTVLNLGLGENTISGSIGLSGGTGATDGTDADYFTFTIAPGIELTSITVDNYTGNDGGISFLGFVADSSFGGQTGDDIDGSVLFGASSGEIISDLTGSTSLGAGDYSFWLQETADVTPGYSLTFTTVPEPSTSLLLGGALCLLGVRRKRN